MDEEARCKPDAEGWCRTHPICELNKPEFQMLTLLRKEWEKAKTLLPPPETQMEVCRGLHEHIKNIAEGTIGACTGDYKSIVKSIIVKFQELHKNLEEMGDAAVERGVMLFVYEQEKKAALTDEEYHEIAKTIRDSSKPVFRKDELVAALAQIKVRHEDLVDFLKDKEILPKPRYAGCISWKMYPGCGEACFGICASEDRQICKDQFATRVGLKEGGHKNA